MRVLVLGGDGMLGHRLLLHLRERHEVAVTLRRKLRDYGQHDLFNEYNSYTNVDVLDIDRVMQMVSDFRPEAIVNAVGLIKQRPESRETLAALEINSVFPHRLNLLCRMEGCRLVHISTDCVFSGEDGNYNEEDISDAYDVYGRTKFLGELHEVPAITLRTSMIGLELHSKHSLVEWFLAQTGKITGYKRAIFSGLITTELCRVIEKVMVEFPEISGLWHVASQPISKYQLLTTLKEKLERTDIEIMPDKSVAIDRSLDAGSFSQATGYRPPSWDEMLYELSGEIRSERGNCGDEAQSSARR